MPFPVQVKVCGITNVEDALAAVRAGAFALGLNFYPHSPRYVQPAHAAEIVQCLPASVWTVGVFVDESWERVADIANEVGLSALQFHGSETPEFCREWPGRKVIKALRVRDAHALTVARTYAVDFILADAYVEGRFGGTGMRVATQYLEGFDRRRLILAGGLTLANVGAAVRVVRPFAVDVASGIESAPGKKDWMLMRSFIANARAA
jgi:phosphoribosylanthranilate isomerase